MAIILTTTQCDVNSTYRNTRKSVEIYCTKRCLLALSCPAVQCLRVTDAPTWYENAFLFIRLNIVKYKRPINETLWMRRRSFIQKSLEQPDQNYGMYFRSEELGIFTHFCSFVFVWVSFRMRRIVARVEYYKYADAQRCENYIQSSKQYVCLGHLW